MTGMPAPAPSYPRVPAARRIAARARIAPPLIALPLLAALALALAGCGTSHPGPIKRGDLAEAQTFPYFKVYWVGGRFARNPLAAVDGLTSSASRTWPRRSRPARSISTW